MRRYLSYGEPSTLVWENLRVETGVEFSHSTRSGKIGYDLTGNRPASWVASAIVGAGQVRPIVPDKWLHRATSFDMRIPAAVAVSGGEAANIRSDLIGL